MSLYIRFLVNCSIKLFAIYVRRSWMTLTFGVRRSDRIKCSLSGNWLNLKSKFCSLVEYWVDQYLISLCIHLYTLVSGGIDFYLRFESKRAPSEFTIDDSSFFQDESELWIKAVKHAKLIWEYVIWGESCDPNRFYLTVSPKIFVA